MTFCGGNELFCFDLSAVVLFAGDLAACEQVVAKVGGGVTAFFGYVGTLDKSLVQGREDDFYIAKEGDVLDVLQIEVNLCFPGDGVASANLSKSAESLTYGVAFALFGGHENHVTHELRSRPDYGHVALEDVEEFRELVEARAAEELAVFGKAHIVREQVAVCVLLVGHGAELDELEDFFVFAGSGLREEGVAAHLERADEGQEQQQRTQTKYCREGATEVQDSFKIAGVQSLQPRFFSGQSHAKATTAMPGQTGC